MKKLSIIILLCMFALAGCPDATTKPDNSENNGINIIGLITFKCDSILDNGQFVGDYLQYNGYSDIKLELIEGGNIAATTHTKTSDTLDGFFVFSNAEKNINYKIRASIGDEITFETDTFTILEYDLIYQDKDRFLYKYGIAPDWMEGGNYYLNLMDDYDTKLVFDLTQQKSNMAIMPQPVKKVGTIQYQVGTTDPLMLSIHKADSEFTNVKTVYSGVNPVGPQAYSFNGGELENGFYIIKYSNNGNSYYYPFNVKN